MVLSAKHDLTTAQTLIYSKKNIARAYEGFDDTDITGIYKIENDRIQIVRHTGDEEVLSASKITQRSILPVNSMRSATSKNSSGSSMPSLHSQSFPSRFPEKYSAGTKP